MSGWIWGIIVAVALGAIGLVDLWADLSGRRTLSSYVIADSKRWPLIPFATGIAIGALMVHFWGC